MQRCPDEGWRDERQNVEGAGHAGESEDAAVADKGPRGLQKSGVEGAKGGPPWSSFSENRIVNLR